MADVPADLGRQSLWSTPNCDERECLAHSVVSGIKNAESRSKEHRELLASELAYNLRIARRDFLKVTGATVIAMPAIAIARANAPLRKKTGAQMEIKRNGSQPSAKGPA